MLLFLAGKQSLVGYYSIYDAIDDATDVIKTYLSVTKFKFSIFPLTRSPEVLRPTSKIN